ncbi:MAG: hypothetical protein HYY11_09835 [Candidatus Methylomirabilis oxyfera]|nr:hypothetical protein [Candidatus Methylomirabilis oxyfera]
MNLEKRLAALEQAQAGSICHDPDPVPLHRLSTQELTELRELIRRAKKLQDDPTAEMTSEMLERVPEGERDRIAELIRKARGEEA